MDCEKEKIALIFFLKIRRIISNCKLNDDVGMVGIYKHILFIFPIFLIKKIIVIYL